MPEDMKKVKELLVKYGFSKPVGDGNFKADVDVHEIYQGAKVELPFPRPEKHRRIVYETYSSSIEETYFWLFNFLTVDLGYSKVLKISDYFTSAESSALFGINQQRLGQQQGQVAQYLGTIASMVKSLFQLVRELRVLEERLTLYADSDYRLLKEGKKKKEDMMGSEVSLKGYWIDLVEGGAKNPGSVLGLAAQVGFTTLPDLFFDAPSMPPEEVDKYVDSLEFNRKVKETLRRKLKVYSIWKKETWAELQNRQKFTLKYLRQHYNTIKLYGQWLKPYLKNVKRMSHKDFSSHPELIAAFEGTIIEIEILAIKAGKGPYFPCINIHIFYRTAPSMSYQQEGFSRGPLHVGKMEIDFRAYSWTQKQIDNYVKFRREEEDDLLMSVTGGVKAAYDALSDDLRKYLEDAGEKLEKEPEKKEKKPAAPPKPPSPFTAVFSGFGELAGALFALDLSSNEKKTKKMSANERLKRFNSYNDSKGAAVGSMWALYNTYKKTHRMITW